MAVVCECGCGCEPDGEWHFTEGRCICLKLGCVCLTDLPEGVERWMIPHLDFGDLRSGPEPPGR